MRRATFIIAAAAVCGCAWWAGVSAGADPVQLAIALIIAWLAQGLAGWMLATRLATGSSAIGVWVSGIAMRLAALLFMWVLYEQALVGRVVALVFGLTLAALVILEAIWLAASSTQIRS